MTIQLSHPARRPHRGRHGFVTLAVTVILAAVVYGLWLNSFGPT